MNWKILTVFTILLNSILIVSACGPYFPSGEDIRFNMLRPEVFKCYGYNAFNLSGHIYYVDNDDYHKYLNETSNTDLNVVWWQSRYQNKFTYDEIYTVLYEQIQLFNADKTDNKFITFTFIYYVFFCRFVTQSIGYCIVSKTSRRDNLFLAKKEE